MVEYGLSTRYYEHVIVISRNWSRVGQSDVQSSGDWLIPSPLDRPPLLLGDYRLPRV